MKNIIITSLLFLCLTGYSQNEKTTQFGVKFGYNRSVINAVELDGSESGFIGNEVYLSFFSDSELNERWNFENELLFSITDEIVFLEIPLHLKIKLFTDYSIFLGPKFDIIINDTQSQNRYKFRNFGASLDIGAQYNFYKRFLVELRYSQGFVEQIDDFGLEFYDGTRNTIRIGAGFKF